MRREAATARNARPTRRARAVGALALAWLAACLALGPQAARAEGDVVRLAVVEMTEPGYVNTTIIPVKRAIERALPSHTVHIGRINSAMLETTVRQTRPDFIIAPAADFVRLVDSTGAHPIATRKTLWARDPSHASGAAVIALASRTDLDRLASLRGARAANTMPSSLDGWLSFEGEILDAGFSPKTFFREIRHFGFSMPHVIEAVLSGAFDVGIVPVCTLERIEAEGLVEPGVLKVIAQKSLPSDPGQPATVCKTSTSLYPDLVIASGPSANPEVIRAAASEILSMTASASSEYRWYPVSDFRSVRALEEKLHIGPWAYLEDTTLPGLWRRFRLWILGGIALLGFLLFTELRLKRLVTKRTEELRRSMREREKLVESEREMRERVERLQRMGALSQLCAIVAHELKQPIGAALNYITVMRVRLGIETIPGVPEIPGARKETDPLVVQSLSGALEQTERISAIVERVRRYARRERYAPVRVSVAPVLASAVKGLRFTKNAPIRLASTEVTRAEILGDALELELIFHNLLKNAAEAVSEVSDPLVIASLSVTDREVIVVISDNGPRLSDEAFDRLSRLSASGKSDGLGLGLGIVRNLVEENGGRLVLTRNAPSGLRAELRFDLLPEGDLPESVMKDV